MLRPFSTLPPQPQAVLNTPQLKQGTLFNFICIQFHKQPVMKDIPPHTTGPATSLIQNETNLRKVETIKHAMLAP
jgi:hypothetical protein